jgi:hypothetical protein
VPGKFLFAIGLSACKSTAAERNADHLAMGSSTGKHDLKGRSRALVVEASRALGHRSGDRVAWSEAIKTAAASR